MTKRFPTLYKQSSTGQIQRWAISVSGNAVTTEYGIDGGKMQTTTDLVKEGTNIGKCNEATPAEQAVRQAQQTWDAKVKKGYTADVLRAAETKNTLGAVQPMLAFPIEKKERHVVFPALAQPKLDGLRCIAIIRSGKARLFSRTQKPIDTVPHIVAELERLHKGASITLDGELYSHKFKDDFNEIIHLVKRDETHADSSLIEYHVYDIVALGGYERRAQAIVAGGHVRLVETVKVASMAELEAYQAKCIERGYEGCMYRNPSGEYENKRSANLLKVKTFQDGEFKITGAEEGKGKLMGAVGAFVLVTGAGVEFRAHPMGTLALWKDYWKRRASLIGKMATVKFQGKTPDGSLRFPVFKCVRTD